MGLRTYIYNGSAWVEVTPVAGVAGGITGVTNIIGTSPVSVGISGTSATVSLSANYQTAGTYVTGVVGTSPISASGTTSITVTIDQALITGATAAENAETLRHYVKNTTGTTIPAYSAVYVSGATGDNALIALSTASTEVGSSKTLGITAESIANDAFGYVIESGYLAGINTTGVTAGSSIWLGNTPGSLVFGAPPAEPSHSVYLGVVIREQQNNGSILVKVQNGYELDELHDVSAGSPTDLDILQYKSSSALWTKASIANAGIAASVHTHDYQASGTYVNAVIGTSPASVSTASGTATVSISSGTATNGTVLTANGSGGVSFTAASSTPEAYYITGYGSVSLPSVTAMPSGTYFYRHMNRAARIDINGTSSNVSGGDILTVSSSSTTVLMPIGWNWNTISTGYNSTDVANNVFYANSEFYITMNNGKLSRSTNGSSFTVSSAYVTTGALNSVAYGGSTYVAVGAAGAIISSSNGTSWTIRTSGTTVALNSVAYRGTTFLAVGNGGVALTSTDGTTWTSRTSGTTNAFITAASNSATFVACTVGLIRTTTDGVTWTSRTNPVSSNIKEVKFGNGAFILITENGEIGRSTDDGATWTEVQTLTTGGGDVWQSIEYLGSSMWIAHKTNGVLWYSFDNGVVWSAISSVNKTIYGTNAVDTGRFAFGQNKLVMVNSNDANDPESMLSTNAEMLEFTAIKLTEITV